VSERRNLDPPADPEPGADELAERERAI
jgi:hypothetical protein